MAALPVHDDAWWAAQTSDKGPHAGRSWWGWGTVSQLRRELASRYKDGAGQRYIRPPTVAEVAPRLPAPKVTVASFPEPLRPLLTDAAFDRLLHARGRDTVDILRNVNGDVSLPHDLVAYPETEADVAALLAECTRRRIAVVPFGGGSSVVQGVEPPPVGAGGTAGCIVIDLVKMNRILEVDEESQCARVQGGLYGPALEAQLKSRGLTFRHFPQSFEFSTVGGWLATRGGGHFATGLTHVDEMCQSVRVVCPAGVTETRRLPASGAGPAEHRLYIGSEGSLGIITEAWIRLRKRPVSRATATVLFEGADADDGFLRGARAVRSLAQTGLQPANLRLVYGPEVGLTGSAHLNPEQQGQLMNSSVLLIGFESADGSLAARTALDAQLQLLLTVAEAVPHQGIVIAKRLATKTASGGDADNTGEREGVAGAWGQGFMRMPFSVSVSCLQPSVLINTIETACNWSAFPALHNAVLTTVRAASERVCGVQPSVTCRFTHVYPDGPAPYYTIVIAGLNDNAVPAGKEDPRIAMWLEIKRCVMDAIIAHGGTSTHHHAVGRLHQPHYEAERGALFGAAFAATKAAHDPSAIMSPGMLVNPICARL